MEDLDCVVSLTSWKGRIYHPDVPKVIYSIIRQKTQYKFKVVLVLSTDEFPNKEEDLPDSIKMMSELNYIEILWCKENLKAYKKYYPTHLKYFNIPIMTTDDDIMLKPNTIETFMNCHKKNPNTIIAEWGHPIKGNYFITGYFRLYPPNALLEIPSFFFTEYFYNAEDDAYNAVLAKLKNTKTKIISSKCVQQIDNGLQKVAFVKTYKKINPQPCINNLLKALKQLKII